MLKEDAMKMRAKDLHELLRAWENYHRILTAEAHMKHIQFREESRYPGFYYRTDKNFVDEHLRQDQQEVDQLQASSRRSGGQVQAVQSRRPLSDSWLMDRALTRRPVFFFTNLHAQEWSLAHGDSRPI